MSANIRYMTQPTDMDGATLRSCLSTHVVATCQSPDAVPVAERNAITSWTDAEGNAVACEIHDHMDEHGRYRRVRRFITVPDLHPEEYGYLNGEVKFLYVCDTCTQREVEVGDTCPGCQWKEETVGPLSIYVLTKWQGVPELVS